MVDVDSMPPVPTATTIAATHIDRLRTWRTRPDRTSAMTDMVASLHQQWTTVSRRIGDFGDAWEACAPSHLRTSCRIDGMRGGVARVIVSSSAVGFQLDRCLRGGLLQELRAACPVAITKVDVRIGRV
jgi:hypothetical protein